MDEGEKKCERRKQRRLEELGTNHFVCPACGCTDWCTAEAHHIGGRSFDKHTEYFCANCHRRLTEAQKSHPKPTSKSPGTGERAGHYGLGIADMFVPVSRMLEQFGHRLLDLSKSNDIVSDAGRRLVGEAGHFLIALAGILERVGVRLREYGINLTNEAQQTVAGLATASGVELRKSHTRR